MAQCRINWPVTRFFGLASKTRGLPVRRFLHTPPHGLYNTNTRFLASPPLSSTSPMSTCSRHFSNSSQSSPSSLSKSSNSTPAAASPIDSSASKPEETEHDSSSSSSSLPKDTRDPRYVLADGAEDSKSDAKATIRRVAQLAKPEKNLIFASIATLGITSSITLLFPHIAGRMLDLTVTQDTSGLTPEQMLGGLGGLMVLAGAGIVARSIMLTLASERVVQRMRTQLFGAMISQEVAFFDHNRMYLSSQKTFHRTKKTPIHPTLS